MFAAAEQSRWSWLLKNPGGGGGTPGTPLTFLRPSQNIRVGIPYMLPKEPTSQRA